MHRITAVSVSSFKRIRDIQITPDADRALLLIAGKNGQGKSSLLDALTSAFGGKRAAPVDAVRHGDTTATITIELDHGAITIEREIDTTGASKLVLRDRSGPVRSPQAMLDSLVGAGRFLDPIAFLYLPPAEQRRSVLAIIGGGQLTKLEETREKVYAARTDLGRDRAKATAALDVIPKARPTAEPIDVAALAEERRKVSDLQRENDGIGNEYRVVGAELARVSATLDGKLGEIQILRERIAGLRTQCDGLEQQQGKLAADQLDRKQKLDQRAVEWAHAMPRVEQIDRQLASANDHNSRIAADTELAKRREAAEVLAGDLETKYVEHTQKLERLERRKQEVITAAKLPVDNLGVAPDHITLNGIPLAQASGAEKLRAALALAMAASPDLADIWIRDGALLDEDSLAIVEAHAAESGHRVWVEVITSADAGAIVISDGRVVGS